MTSKWPDIFPRRFYSATPKHVPNSVENGRGAGSISNIRNGIVLHYLLRKKNVFMFLTSDKCPTFPAFY